MYVICTINIDYLRILVNGNNQLNQSEENIQRNKWISDAALWKGERKTEIEYYRKGKLKDDVIERFIMSPEDRGSDESDFLVMMKTKKN
jgi:hypothetical protein